MYLFQSFAARRAGTLGAFTAVLLYVGVAAATAQDLSTSSNSEIGRIEFDHAGTAKKSVEVNLSPDMFGDLFGIGDAALAGVADALSDSSQAKEGSQAVQLAAEKAAAAREFVAIAKSVVKSVRVRAYEDLANATEEQANVAAHYESQLKSGGWENAVKARDGDKTVQVAAVRSDGAIRGLFVVASEGNNLVLVNVTCDISPENAKRLTTAAVRAGLQAGLDKQLEEAMKHMK
ncbi:MAG: DUF4252 domain-containing protein [Pirellulales bacterium]